MQRTEKVLCLSQLPPEIKIILQCDRKQSYSKLFQSLLKFWKICGSYISSSLEKLVRILGWSWLPGPKKCWVTSWQKEKVHYYWSRMSRALIEKLWSGRNCLRESVKFSWELLLLRWMPRAKLGTLVFLYFRFCLIEKSKEIRQAAQSKYIKFKCCFKDKCNLYLPSTHFMYLHKGPSFSKDFSEALTKPYCNEDCKLFWRTLNHTPWLEFCTSPHLESPAKSHWKQILSTPFPESQL